MRPPAARLTLVFASLAVLAAVPATATPAQGTAAALPCDRLSALTEGAGYDMDERRWRFHVLGDVGTPGAYVLDVASDHADVFPVNRFTFFEGYFSHFRGTLARAGTSYAVDLVWYVDDSDPVDLLYNAEFYLQQFVSMHLIGTATAGDEELPLNVWVTLAAPPQVCSAGASAFPWLRLCVPSPLAEGPAEVCVPVGYEISGGLEVYYNGAALLRGQIDAAETAGVGTAHGTTTLLGFWGAVPF